MLLWERIELCGTNYSKLGAYTKWVLDILTRPPWTLSAYPLHMISGHHRDVDSDEQSICPKGPPTSGMGRKRQSKATAGWFSNPVATSTIFSMSGDGRRLNSLQEVLTKGDLSSNASSEADPASSDLDEDEHHQQVNLSGDFLDGIDFDTQASHLNEGFSYFLGGSDILMDLIQGQSKCCVDIEWDTNAFASDSCKYSRVFRLQVLLLAFV
ncbi:hypothetical protein K435DRAFT_802456 [Dendrothele bispora CBS 962.96]|uniref:Uncharacterized protein n=1 Tax=Dendrothele bispora (strain CBS 962.96) TaxID=1314807 RepID=A0A4S8LKQ5_DENBC|nr:hypothetical protein K435DRAFT_802456 [Dendrothele bispora CBS 962.96]